MVLCLIEPPRRFLFVVVYSVLLFILLLLFFISFPGYFTMSPAVQPGFSGPWRPPPALSSIPITFDCLAFSSTANATVLSGGFFTHRRFLPYALSPTFSSVYQGLPGSQQFFLEVCRVLYWSWKHRPSPSVCLIHSNPQSSYSGEFIFKIYRILSWITCGKKFSLYAPYSFRTRFACSKSYIKTIKKHFEQGLYCL